MTGKQLRSVRKKLGLSQREFSLQLGLSTKSGHLCRMENGQETITRKMELIVRRLERDGVYHDAKTLGGLPKRGGKPS